MDKQVYVEKLTSYFSERELKTIALISERCKDPAWQRFYEINPVLCKNK
jgi:hypothetical protein